jgi:hypothetical protein
MWGLGWLLVFIGCIVAGIWPFVVYDNHKHWESGPEDLARRLREAPNPYDSVQPLRYETGLELGGTLAGLGLVVLAIQRVIRNRRISR